MRTTTREFTERDTVAGTMIARDRKPMKPAPPRVVGKSNSFDVSAFFNRTLLSRKLVDFQKNEVMFSAGDPASSVLFVEKGLIRLTVTSGAGKTAVVAVLDAGSFCGIWCLADQPRRTATATAMAPTTARVIPKDQMIRLLRSDPAFSEYFVSYLLKRNMQLGQQIVNLLFDSRERRLIRALLFLSQFGAVSGDDATLTRVPQEQLAEMIGSTRTHVNTFMTKLKRLGLVEYSRGMLRIHRTPLMSLL